MPGFSFHGEPLKLEKRDSRTLHSLSSNAVDRVDGSPTPFLASMDSATSPPTKILSEHL